MGEDGKWQTDDIASNLIAHAILGAVVAELQGNSGLAGGAGAVAGEVAADIIRKQLYGKEVKDLTEEEKQTISALSQLASGLAVAAGGGNIGDASAAISSSKNAVENNTESMDWWREKHKGSIDYYKDKLRETLGENTISQIINGALTAYGDTVDLGAGAADTVLDGVLALSSCAVGVNYCDTALNDLRKADQTVANAVNAIINGQAWDAIKDNFVKAANGDQIALENSAALLIGVITPSKGLGNVGKTEKLINKSDKVISDANKAGKLDEALSDVNKLDKEYFENQYGKNNVEQGFGDYKETKDKVIENITEIQKGNDTSSFGEYNKLEGKVQEDLGIWPPNSGAYGPIEKVTLKPGATVDRYGYDTGYYISPEGIAFEQRAIPSSSLEKPYKVYEIIKPIEDVSQSKVLPWFGQPGQGTQYKLPKPVKWYLDNGYIKEVIKQ